MGCHISQPLHYEVSLMSFQAVSYTHLDVYKRQEDSERLLPLRGGNLI